VILQVYFSPFPFTTIWCGIGFQCLLHFRLLFFWDFSFFFISPFLTPPPPMLLSYPFRPETPVPPFLVLSIFPPLFTTKPSFSPFFLPFFLFSESVALAVLRFFSHTPYAPPHPAFWTPPVVEAFSSGVGSFSLDLPPPRPFFSFPSVSWFPSLVLGFRQHRRPRLRLFGLARYGSPFPQGTSLRASPLLRNPGLVLLRFFFFLKGPGRFVVGFFWVEPRWLFFFRPLFISRTGNWRHSRYRLFSSRGPFALVQWGVPTGSQPF